MKIKTEEINLEEQSMELENRVKNLLWTVSGDYSQEMKPDVSLFLRSRDIALYDGIKQGALARFYDKNLLGIYLVKKIFLGAEEGELTTLAQLCIEEAIGDKICEERPGVKSIQKQAFLDILDQEYEKMPAPGDLLGMLRFQVLRDRVGNGSGSDRYRDMVKKAHDTRDTMELIRVIDELYNRMVDPDFEKKKGSLEDVLAVTMEDLTEFDWKDYLTEEMYEEALESYLEQLTNNLSGMENSQITQEMEEQRQQKYKIVRVSPEALEKAHTYVELNYGITYLTENEEKRMNHLMCRGIHNDCSLYFTEGILKSPAKRNYQYEYAVRLRNKNIWLYHDKHRIVKQNIKILTDMLRKSLVIRSETQEIFSDRGSIVPSRLWRIGRSSDARLFRRELKGDAADFVVDVLIDASGSQRSRQEQVALQAYIISEALSNVGIPHRVMSYCTFWDYTILHRFRKYDDSREANQNIFDYMTSSNNRDGLAIRAAGYELLNRDEEKKIMIILSDGRPQDVVINRKNSKNPPPYRGAHAISDTATQVRALRNAGISVLGVFAGEETDLAAEKKIFGKDFAYIRTITNFSRIVGRYLTRQLELDS